MKVREEDRLTAFHTFYGALHGDRWATLAPALLRPRTQVARWNRFQAGTAAAWFAARGIAAVDVAGLEGAYQIPADTALEPVGGRMPFYWMDAGSILAARSLPVNAGDRVLDLCSAPGGKTLILAERLGEGGSLVANELSASRRGSLRRVLAAYLPADRMAQVRVTGHDAARWCRHEQDACDAILLDAPCSGERHLLADPGEMRRWTRARSPALAQRQYALLSSALRVVRPGGHLLYATCSVSPLENDGVVQRALDRLGARVEPVPVSAALGEPTSLGWTVFPDRFDAGPVYWSLLRRMS